MKIFWCLLKKELRTCFLSPIAFVVMFFFWVLMGGRLSPCASLLKSEKWAR